MTGAWFRRDTYDIERQDNLLRDRGRLHAVPYAEPARRQAGHVYNLNRAKQGLVDLLDTTATDRSKARVNYNGLEVSFTARLPHGASAFGGWSADRQVNVTCAGDDPNTFRYCDQSQYRYSVPIGLQAGRQLSAAL